MINFCCFKRKETLEDGDIQLPEKKRSPFERLNDPKVRSGIALGFFVLCIVTALVVGVPGGIGISGHFVPFLESITHVFTLPGSTAMAIIGGAGTLGATGFSFWFIMECALIPRKKTVSDVFDVPNVPTVSSHAFDAFFLEVDETNILHLTTKEFRELETKKPTHLPDQCATICKCEGSYSILVKQRDLVPWIFKQGMTENSLEGAKKFMERLMQGKPAIFNNVKPFLRK